MIHILLLILKIILWIILAILGIVLLLVLLVLFMPIKYRAEIDYHDKTKIRARVNYLIVSVRIIYDQASGNMDNIIRICGFRLGGKKKKTKTKTKKLKKSPKPMREKLSSDIDEEFGADEIIRTDEEAKASEENRVDEDAKNSEESRVGKEAKAVEETIVNEIAKEDKKSDVNVNYGFEDASSVKSDKSTKKLSKEHKKQDKLAKKEVKQQAKERRKAANGDKKADVSKKLEVLKHKADSFKKFWELECTVKTREYLGKYIIGLFKHVGPRRIKGYVNYGFSEPCTTGQVTGYLSLMPFVYKKGFSLRPDFHNKVLEAEVKFKGHIRLAYIIRIVFKVNIWRTVKAAKKYLAD